jgi:hypothetical protein
MTATRIIIVGYSMPSIDQHFKYLLTAGLQDNISLRKIFIVNPALETNHADRETLLQRIFGVFREEMRKRGTIELLAGKASETFFRTDFRARINRNFPKGFEQLPLSFV